MTLFFVLQKLLSFRRSNLFTVVLVVCATGDTNRKWSPVLKCYSLLPTFPSIWFSVVGFILRSLIHLDLSFVHGDRYGSIFILLEVDIQLCQHHLLKMFSFFHCVLLAPLSKIRCLQVCGLILGSLIHSIGKHLCFYANTKLFSLLQLCNRV